jgi:hypothetical protein
MQFVNFFKNKKYVRVLLITLIIIVIGIWTYKCVSKPIKTDPYKELIEKIDSLNYKIETLELQRDTINN